MLGLEPHDAITRDLGEDRGGRDAQAARVALHEAAAVAEPDEVPLAVDEHDVGTQAHLFEGAPGSQPLRLGHAERVALLLRGMADAPGAAPTGQPVVERLALALGEHLRLAHLVDAPVGRQHRCSNGDGAGPRATPDLVHADDDVMALGPQLALEGEAGRRLPVRLPQRGDGDRHRPQSTQANSTAGAPSTTWPTTVNPRPASAAATWEGTAASSPPEVCGSKAMAVTASG